jgi:hypothetical protein
MNKRRQFLKISIAFLVSTGAFLSPLFSSVRWAYAKAKKTILPKGSKRESLFPRNTGLPCGLWERAIMDLTGPNTFIK